MVALLRLCKKRKDGNGRRAWMEESRCGKNEESGRRVKKWERVQISNVEEEPRGWLMRHDGGEQAMTGLLLVRYTAATTTAIPAVLY